MLAQAKTDIGKLRETNEDRFICKEQLFVVADGMGGHVAGEIASRMATDAIAKIVDERNPEESIDKILEVAIIKANNQIYQFAEQNEDFAGMGTTVTAVYIEDGKVYWGHVGDSRLYLCRDGQMLHITQDHSLVGELLRSGSISKEDAINHPQRNILTRAVGTDDSITIDTGIFDWLKGDKLLLCTDGLTNMVPDGEIYQVLQAAADGSASIVEQLVDRANNAGGFDNITVILVENGDA